MQTASTSAIFEPDWRIQHCAEAAAQRLKEATGRDIWEEFGGCPRSWREAAAFYRRLGVTNFRDAVSAVLGPPFDPKLAHRGDIAMVDNALGIVRGEWVECDRMQPLHRAQCCWRVA